MTRYGLIDLGVAILVGVIASGVLGVAVALGAAREAREWWRRREVASA